MSGVVATAIVAHVPTLGLEKNIPDFQKNLPVAERAMGAALRAHLKPDLWVMVSSHWVATFDWLITAHARHTGVCVADEAPYLIPGVAYDYKGDPLLATLAETLTAQGVPAALNESGHYHWDYGSFVPDAISRPARRDAGGDHALGGAVDDRGILARRRGHRRGGEATRAARDRAGEFGAEPFPRARPRQLADAGAHRRR